MAATDDKTGPVPVPFPVKLERIITNLRKRGVTVMEGEAAERLLRSINARAAYWPAEGGPGTVILPRNPTRSMVVEELMHHGQYLNRGFPSTNPAINPTLGLEIEIEAQRRLMQHATRKAWTQAEIDAFGAALKEWQKLLSEAK